MASDTKTLFNWVKAGAGLAIGVILVNGALSMVRRYTGFPPGEFSL